MIEKAQDMSVSRIVLETEEGGPRLDGRFHAHRIVRDASDQEWQHLSADEHVTLAPDAAMEIFEECHRPGEWQGRRVQAVGETKLTGPAFYRSTRHYGPVRRTASYFSAQSKIDPISGSLLGLLVPVTIVVMVLSFCAALSAGLLGEMVAIFVLSALFSVFIWADYRSRTFFRGELTDLHFPGEQCIAQITEKAPSQE
jgi:hypothetical protein